MCIRDSGTARLQQPENQRRKHPGCQQYICGVCGPVLEGNAVGCLPDGLGQAGQHEMCIRDRAAPVAGKVVSAGAEGNWGTVVVLEDAAGRSWRLCGVADPAVRCV